MERNSEDRQELGESLNDAEQNGRENTHKNTGDAVSAAREPEPLGPCSSSDDSG